MQMVDQSGSVAESAFRLFRLLVNFLIFLAAARWGIRTFLLNPGGAPIAGATHFPPSTSELLSLHARAVEK